MNNENTITDTDPPKGFKWGEPQCRFDSNGDDILILRPVRTHRPDGTPLEIDPLPDMPENVDRVEYFGTGMKSRDIGDSNFYIYFYEGDEFWGNMSEVGSGWKEKLSTGDEKAHYARVWYKKAKTKLSDLIGEDYQGKAYIIKTNGDMEPFAPLMENGVWEDLTYCREELQSEFRWSHSPFTPYKQANKFNF